MSGHRTEIEQKQRFEFGANWTQFLELLSEDRICMAEDSLKNMLNINDLNDKTFLDIGSGSGLFSLAARRLGARVHSFDYDPKSVACTQELKRRYFNDDPDWVIEEASALDKDYLSGLGQFDVVYSWGVLHHTGEMWQALENVPPLVADQGQLFIAIYNYQGIISRYWTWVKKTYNRSLIGKVLMTVVHAPYLFLMRWLLKKLRKQTNLQRGMDLWRDAVDWLGGYPFEVAKPEQIFVFFKSKNFSLMNLKTCGGRLGCNEFVFKKHASVGLNE